MFPRSRKRRQQQQEEAETEADEERMASRLQLDMGTYLLNFADMSVYTYRAIERDSLARKSARGGSKMEAVNVFRGISFDDWLRLFMQVRCHFFFRKTSYA
jgi:general transcription factor 3C polypeptide 3 (transcription factor C subunit 4)